jgi:hypothetical protein
MTGNASNHSEIAAFSQYYFKKSRSTFYWLFAGKTIAFKSIPSPFFGIFMVQSITL